ncbi:hypothetical protein BKA56DRAFT_593823 [Ilyonectria sp. MPI-CAGE-AT-0026]|nr:hypothetical protein BKA56DRAFT_593823 [Ilyonectria sp. MPI-CAGE-AT-0026]
MTLTATATPATRAARLTKNCSYCSRKFSKVEHLKRHERSHTGEKPFECGRCRKRFARGDVLNRHVKGHMEAAGELWEGSENRPAARSPRRNTARTTASGSGPENLDSPSETTDSPVETCSPPRREGHEAMNGQHPQHTETLDEIVAALPSPTTAIGPQETMDSSTTPIEDTRWETDLAGIDVDINAVPNMTGTPRVPQPVQVQYFPQLDFPGDLIASASLPQGVHVDDSAAQDASLQATLAAAQQNNDSTDWMNLFDDDTIPTSFVTGCPIDTSENVDFMDMDVFIRALRRPSQPTHEIPDERFARIAKLWPNKKKLPWRLIGTLWHDAASHKGDNIFSAGPDDGPHARASPGSPVAFKWDLDEERRGQLIEECSSNRNSSNSLFNSHSGAGGHQSQSGDDFPSAEVLDMSLDLFFRRFHQLLPFIHQQTFTAKSANISVVNAMCLIGLALLDPQNKKSFVAMQLPGAIERCRVELARPWKSHDAAELLSALGCSVLLLSLSTTDPERVHDEQTQMLYNDTLMMALKHNIFAAHESTRLSSTVFERGWSGEEVWKAWARIESVKRLIVGLIMIDSFFANNLGTCPIIKIEAMQFYAPCTAELFKAPDSLRWASLVNAGCQVISPILDFRQYPVTLPAAAGASVHGLNGVLAAAWLRIADARHRLNTGSGLEENKRYMIPAELYARDGSAKVLTPLLMDIYAAYHKELNTVNPNCLVFWHRMCLDLTANLSTFELAAGRGGPESGRAALADISQWTQTSAARRACLHAAQTFSCMSRRKISDGTMFVSEMAIFNSALVLALYLYMLPQLDASEMQLAPEPFELLDNVDWNQVGYAGINYGHSTADILDCPARRFIKDGGTISFGGIIYPGGYSSARRILLEYLDLLEEVGKWNVTNLCRILRIMSDSITGETELYRLVE